MTDIQGIYPVAEFVKSLNEPGLLSTSCQVVSYNGKLYNVNGSTRDPKMGESWKQLLINYGINRNCYVTSPPAGGKSHPQFDVGGHMTPNQDGSVPDGGQCYMMPLCHGHNAKSMDGKAFSHTETKILKLSGYMQGELAATFQLRLPSTDPYAVLYYADGDWKYKNLSEEQAADLRANVFDKIGGGQVIEHYALVKRVQKDSQTLHNLQSFKLPE